MKRLFDRIVKHGPDGCHIWQGATSEGYGVIKVDGKCIGVHRYIWQLVHGDIPAGMCVLHKCDEPCCCNVKHLFLGTKADNNRDRSMKGHTRNRYMQ